LLTALVFALGGISAALAEGNTRTNDPAFRAAVRSEREVAAAVRLLDAKFAFLRWAEMDLHSCEPTLAELKTEHAALQAAIKEQDGRAGTNHASKATRLLWRAFRETKPMLDARPGDRQALQKRFTLVLGIVSGSIAFADEKIASLHERAQDPAAFTAQVKQARKLVSQAQQEFDAGNAREGLRRLSEAVPPVDQALVQMPRNSAGF
jgi:hypothetical protein